MIPAPLGFFEVEEEELRADSPELDETEFGVTPKAFDAVDMILSTRKLIVVMVDAAVFVASQHQAVVPEPAVGIDRGCGKHLSFDDRLQLCTGTVFHHFGKDPTAALEQPDHRRLSRRSASAPPPHAPGAKIRLINLHLAGKRPGFLDGQFQCPRSQQTVKPLPRVAIDPKELARAGGWNVRAKHLQQPLEFTL